MLIRQNNNHKSGCPHLSGQSLIVGRPACTGCYSVKQRSLRRSNCECKLITFFCLTFYNICLNQFLLTSCLFYTNVFITSLFVYKEKTPFHSHSIRNCLLFLYCCHVPISQTRSGRWEIAILRSIVVALALSQESPRNLPRISL